MNVTLGDCCTPRLDYLLKNGTWRPWRGSCWLQFHMWCSLARSELARKACTCICARYVLWWPHWEVILYCATYVELNPEDAHYPQCKDCSAKPHINKDWLIFFVACKLSVCLSLYKQSFHVQLFMSLFSGPAVAGLLRNATMYREAGARLQVY